MADRAYFLEKKNDIQRICRTGYNCKNHNSLLENIHTNKPNSLGMIHRTGN